MNEDGNLAENRLLSRCLSQQPEGDFQQHEDRMATIESEERSLRRALCVMFVVFLLGLGGAGHSAILLKDATPYALRMVINIFATFGIGALISLLVFSIMWGLRRNELAHHRQELRRSALQFISTRLAVPEQVRPSTTLVETSTPKALLDAPQQ